MRFNKKLLPANFASARTDALQRIAVVLGSVRNTCEISVGRLLEVRILAGHRSRPDVESWFEQINSELAKVKATQRVVSVSDWRACPPLSDHISKLLVEKLGEGNSRVQAAAAIVDRDSPADVIRFLAEVCSKKSSGRRLFFDVAELTSWMHPFLTGAEFRRLCAFVQPGVLRPARATRVRPGRTSPRDCG